MFERIHPRLKGPRDAYSIFETFVMGNARHRTGRVLVGLEIKSQHGLADQLLLDWVKMDGGANP